MANIDNIETMGIFGWTWPEKVAGEAKKFLLKDQARYINTTMVNNVHQKYLSLLTKGYSSLNFNSNNGDIKYRTWNINSLNIMNALKNELNIPIIYIDAIFRALFLLATTGKIPFDKLDPKQVQSTKKDIQIFKPDNLGSVLDTVKLLTIGAVGITAMIVFNKVKRD